MSGVFTIATGTGRTASQAPQSGSLRPTGQRVGAGSGPAPPSSYLILREDGSGHVELEAGSGSAEREVGP